MGHDDPRRLRSDRDEHRHRKRCGVDGFRPGSLGRALPGHHVGIIDAEGNELPVGIEGDLAVRGRPPTLFAGYWESPEETKTAFRGDWYLTGDVAKADEEGFFWFVGRAEDVISSSGRTFGPYEVERVLREHQAIAASAVVGLRDLQRGGQFVRAYVVPARGRARIGRARGRAASIRRTSAGRAAGSPRNRLRRRTADRPRAGEPSRRFASTRSAAVRSGSSLRRRSPRRSILPSRRSRLRRPSSQRPYPRSIWSRQPAKRRSRRRSRSCRPWRRPSSSSSRYRFARTSPSRSSRRNPPFLSSPWPRPHRSRRRSSRLPKRPRCPSRSRNTCLHQSSCPSPSPSPRPIIPELEPAAEAAPASDPEPPEAPTRAREDTASRPIHRHCPTT